MKIKMAVLVIALALAGVETRAHACGIEPIVKVGLGYADNYQKASVGEIHYDRIEGTTRVRADIAEKRWPSPLGLVTIGAECGPVSLVAEHYSSIPTSHDPGVNMLRLEVDLVSLFKK